MKNKITIIVVGILVFIGGFWYIQRSGTPNSQAAVLQSDAAIPQELQGLSTSVSSTKLDDIEKKLNGAILQSPVFQSLKDFTSTVVQEPQGRRNPFAPLGVDATSPSSASTNAPAIPAAPTGN